MIETMIEQYRVRVAQALDQRLPAADLHPGDLHQAMRYAVLGGGKRIRPILVYAAGTAVGATLEALDGPACAVEFIHAYSLIHDDLPAMDNDDLRHGQPTCHKAFGEALAILAGDALQALAFQVLCQDAAMIAKSLNSSADAGHLGASSRFRGMVGGQAIDLAAVGRGTDLAELENMHIHKTGALIRASVLLGALSQPTVESTQLERLDHYAKCIGLGLSNPRRHSRCDRRSPRPWVRLQGSDRALEQTDVSGVAGTGRRPRTRPFTHQDALASLASFGAEADPLRWMAHYIVERAY
jgi:geranylgeranyl pyrophosphate synthase